MIQGRISYPVLVTRDGKEANNRTGLPIPYHRLSFLPEAVSTCYLVSLTPSRQWLGTII